MRFLLATFIALVVTSTAVAKTKGDVQNVPELKNKNLSEKNIQFFLEEFVKAPHPMGSKQQAQYALQLKNHLVSFGLDVELQKTLVQAPSAKSKEVKLVTKDLINVVAVRAGKANCGVVIGGHYDTKDMPNFVGANDGGSSTAAMLEMARNSNLNSKKSDANDFFSCDLIFTFFDGEEAQLSDWDDGQRLLKMQDNLYGSRNFVESLKTKNGKKLYRNKPLILTIIVDMIGHKNQSLIATEGSDKYAIDSFLKHSKNVSFQASRDRIEDDHIPFMNANIPVLHIIDWKNLKEWHTPDDNLSIVSAKRIKNFCETLLNMLGERRFK